MISLGFDVVAITCDWIWENHLPHNYKYLEIPNLIISSIVTQELRKADACMKFATILWLFIVYLFINYWADSYVAELPTILDIFMGVANTTSTPIGWGMGGSNEYPGKGCINTENNQMAFTGAILTPHITQRS